MKSKDKGLAIIEECGVVAVIRATEPELAVSIAQAVAEGGILPIEITMTVPDAFNVIATVNRKLGEHIFLGAGTVLEPVQAVHAIAAGARFIVSPIFDPRIIHTCRKKDTPVIPGAFTPTEIITAWHNGADIVKLFPASLGGPGLINDLRGPFPDIRLLPTGGVTLENAGSFIKAGAVAVAIGSNLVNKTAVASGNWDVISDNARKFAKAVQEARKAT
jgi:2-dehydro-3-deoxyphosphogluconate aldolase/(4S)-4-hydroxy-2-oxoglutarate aldolase